ncbi:MAG: hypothetical protein OT477_20980 [Chloroflexi bacterium]|nr:hypothetical protein [Chloroflexota bacterium]
MNRFLGYLFLIALLGACASPTPPPTPRGLGGVVEAPTAAPTPAPQLQLTSNQGQPGQEIAILGTDFPPSAAVEIALSTAANPRQIPLTLTAEIDEQGAFAAPFTLPTLWPGSSDTAESIQLLIRATSLTVPSQTAETSLTLDYSDAFQPYRNDEMGFSLDLPLEWVVEGPLRTPLGTMYLVGKPPLQPGDPSVSTFLVAPSEQWSAIRAAEQLLCGGGCVSDVRFTLTTVNDMPARELLIETEGVPPLTWYFVEQDNQLLYFSLHDPITFATLDRLVQTVRFQPTSAATAALDLPTATPEIIAIVPTPAPTEPAATAEPTPEPTATPDLREVGPVQMVNDLLAGVLQQRLFSVSEAEYQFTAAYLAANEPRPLLLTALQLNQLLKQFSVAREDAGGVVVRAEIVLLDDTRVARLFTMVKEDEVWRIDQIEPADLPQPATTEAPTETPTAEPEGDT